MRDVYGYWIRAGGRRSASSCLAPSAVGAWAFERSTSSEQERLDAMKRALGGGDHASLARVGALVEREGVDWPDRFRSIASANRALLELRAVTALPLEVSAIRAPEGAFALPAEEPTATTSLGWEIVSTEDGATIAHGYGCMGVAEIVEEEIGVGLDPATGLFRTESDAAAALALLDARRERFPREPGEWLVIELLALADPLRPA